jgi:carbamoyl-phosphate synthase large subunit
MKESGFVTPGPVNILFMSVGRRVELVRAFRDAYERLRLAGRIIAMDIDPLAPGLRVADIPLIVPRLDDPAFAPRLIEACREHQVSLVFPLIDPDIPVLGRLAPDLAAIGAHAATISSEHVATVSDKWQTYQFFNRLQLPTPKSWLPGDVDPERLEYPVFVKPRFGSASVHTYAARDPEELRFFQRYVPNAIIQELLPGPEITSDVVCDHTGSLLGVVSRRRIEVRWGEVAKGVTCLDPAFVTACRRIASVLRPAGPITVQGLLKDDVVHLTEINARMGGGLPLGIAAGADSPRWLLARAADLPVEIPPVGSYQKDVYLSRFDESVFLSRSTDGTFQSHHL